MNEGLKLLTTLLVGGALASGSIMVTPAAHAATDAAQVQTLMAPTLASGRAQAAYYKTTHRYDWGPNNLFPKPGIIDEYLILAEGTKESKSTQRPYEYSYRYRKTYDAKKPSEIHQQGVSQVASQGGSWIRRGDAGRLILPLRLSRLDDNTIITNLNDGPRRVRSLTDDIAGVSPVDKALSMVDLSSYPVREGTLTLQDGGLGDLRGSRANWRTGAYTNAQGDNCDNSWIKVMFKPDGTIWEFEVDEASCTTASNTNVGNYIDGSIRPWDAIVGSAPEPNVSYND